MAAGAGLYAGEEDDKMVEEEEAEEEEETDDGAPPLRSPGHAPLPMRELPAL